MLATNSIAQHVDLQETKTSQNHLQHRTEYEHAANFMCNHNLQALPLL